MKKKKKNLRGEKKASICDRHILHAREFNKRATGGG